MATPSPDPDFHTVYVTVRAYAPQLEVETDPRHPGWVYLRDRETDVDLSLPPGHAWRLGQALLAAARRDAEHLAAGRTESAQ